MRDGTFRLLRLLPEGGGRLESGKGQEAVDNAEKELADTGVPLGTKNTENENVCPPGALWVSSLTRTTSDTTRMSATVMPSMPSRALAPTLTGRAPRAPTATRASALNTNEAQSGGVAQMSVALRKAVTKMPTAAEVITANSTYTPISAHPATTPNRGPSVAPTKP